MRGSERRGFVLVVVLWYLVAMALATALVVYWVRDRISDAQADRAGHLDRAAVISNRDTLLFIAATVPMTRAGQPLEPEPEADLLQRRLDDFGGFDSSPRGDELRLDGHTYAGLGSFAVAIQDEAGLLNLAAPTGPWLNVLFEDAGVPRARRAALFASLQDYIDADDLRRFNGAESSVYEREGRAAPEGRPLIAPGEIGRIHGWADLAPATLARLEEALTAVYVGPLNVNTAPSSLLKAILQDCRAVCVARLEAIGGRAFATAGDAELALAARLPGDRDINFRTSPSDQWRLTLQPAEGRPWRIHVRLTPMADRAAPWTVDAAYRVPRPADDDDPEPIPSPLFAPSAMAGR